MIRSKFIKYLCIICLVILYGIIADAVEADAPFSVGKENWTCSRGKEFPGAQASMVWIKDPEKGDAMRIDYSFTGGGCYIGGIWHGLVPEPNTILTLWMKGVGSTLRVRDITGQWIATRLDPPHPTKWTRMRIDLSNITQEAHFEGANDGKIHFPITALMIGSDDHSGKQLFVSQIAFSKPLQAASIYWSAEILHKTQGSGIVFPQEKVDCDIIITNRQQQDSQIQATIDITNDNGKSTQQHFAAKIKAGNRFTAPVSLNSAAIGMQSIVLTVTAEDKIVARAESALAVVPPPFNYGTDDSDRFFGLCEIWDYVAAERMGCRTVRRGISWRGGNNQPEAFNDIIYHLTQSHMTCLLTVSSEAPDGAIRSDKKYGFIPDAKKLPDWGMFMKYVTTTIKNHAEGKRFTVIEIDNEPELGFWLARGLPLEEAISIYAQVYKVGSDAIRAANPQQTVGGISACIATFEMKMGFADRIFASGCKSDIFTGHPYPVNRNFGFGSNPVMPDDYGFDKRLKFGLDLMSQFGMPRRFAIGEFGWTLDGDQSPLSRYALLEGAAVARSFVIAKSIPDIEGIYYFTQRPYTENGTWYGLFRGEQGKMYPLPGAGVYAACANALHAATPVRQLKPAQAIRAWWFDRKADNLAVVPLWTVEGTAKILAALPASTKVYNMFGREIASGTKLEMTVDELPVYAVAAYADREKLAQGIETATITAGKTFSIKNCYINRDDQIILDLVNYTSESLPLTIKIDRDKQRYDLPTGQTRFPVKIDPALTSNAGPISITVADGKTVEEPALPGGVIQIEKIDNIGPDGNLEKRSKLMPQIADQRKQVQPPDPMIPWHGDADLSLNLKSAWNNEGLYFAVTVRDDIHYTVPQPTIGNFWMGDSIQIAIDPQGDSTTSYGPAVREIGMALDGKQVKTFCLSDNFNCKAFAVRRNGETIYEILIPWSSLSMNGPQPGKVMAINVIANDDDGNGRKCWIGLTPGIGDSKCPRAYKRFVLQK